MSQIEIKNRNRGDVIASGDNIKDLVETTRMNLVGADLRGADLRGAYLVGANLRVTHLQGADLRDANLEGADLRGAYLHGADLVGANLFGADLRSTDLRDANLVGADLRDADLRRTFLLGANLDGEILIKTPIFIDLEWRITITTEFMRIGCRRYKITEWEKFSDDEIEAMAPNALSFWKVWKQPLLMICANHKMDYDNTTHQ